jgi:spore coat protein U-like protein
MTDPSSSLLPYGLFSDAGCTTNWGNTAATGWVARTGNGGNQSFTVYGQIPANQHPVPGSFTGTITASVFYGTAQTASTTFAITAVNASACTISANALAFGTYARLLVNSTSTISVTVRTPQPTILASMRAQPAGQP